MYVYAPQTQFIIHLATLCYLWWIYSIVFSKSLSHHLVCVKEHLSDFLKKLPWN